MPMGVPSPGVPGYEAARLVDHIAELEAIGIAGLVLMLPAPSRDALVDALAQFGSDVIQPASTDGV